MAGTTSGSLTIGPSGYSSGSKCRVVGTRRRKAHVPHCEAAGTATDAAYYSCEPADLAEPSTVEDRVLDKKTELRLARHHRVRKKVIGTAEKPRLNVFRSIANIYAQVIDDTTGQTIVSASTLDAEVKPQIKTGGNAEAAKAVGALIGKRAAEKGIKHVVFDRGGYKYHGRVQSLADAAREAGLEF